MREGKTAEGHPGMMRGRRMVGSEGMMKRHLKAASGGAAGDSLPRLSHEAAVGQEDIHGDMGDEW